MKLNRIQILIFFTSLFLWVLAFFISFSFDQLKLFPFDQNEYEVGTYHEPRKKDFSKASVRITNNKIDFAYKLTDSLTEPFAGMFIRKKDTLNSFVNLSPYSKIDIHIEGEGPKSIPIIITLDYEGYTVNNKELTSLPFTYFLDYDEPGVYTIDIQNFKIQDWWFREKGLKKEDFKEYKFSRANYFVVESDKSKQKPFSKIIISDITFYNSNKQASIFLGLGLIGVFSMLVVFYFINKRKTVLVPYQVTETNPMDADGYEINKIAAFIAENYSNANLSAADIQDGIGISSRKIGTLLKEHYGVSLKNYLNKIRLAEVKRKLRETKTPISDIAYDAGYNNISHFNRIFKNAEGVSPKQYRDIKDGQ